ncbi:MAG: ABC transporter ATP-binding protein [Eubacterium ramulus]
MMELRTENLVVGYDKAPLIKDVNLKVVSGQVLTLIGPNGAGKSTILKTITRQLKRIGGTIYLGQESMNNMRDSDVSKSLSMVMTERLQTELLTGRDVVASGRYPYTGRFGILAKEDWEKVDEAIALVHAQDVQDQDFRKMSDGQRQRLMLARAICQDTDILLLDEPTSYLDMGFKLDILANIRMLARERNLAIIMSLHELDLAQKVSDTIACVKGDHIDRIGTPEEIFSGDYVQQLYGVTETAFDPVTGEVFLQGAKSEPKVFVIGGCGSGIAAYNRLQRENVPFVAGILQKNDLEYPTARALAAEVVSQKAFYPIEKAQIEEAKKWMEQCETCICTLPMEAFGPLNEANRELLEYAKEIGKLSM